MSDIRSKPSTPAYREGWDRVFGKKDQCLFQPELLPHLPLGKFHCPVCGEMVVSGSVHPR